MSNLLKCRGCYQFLPTSNFYKQHDSQTGFRSKCRICFNQADYVARKKRKATDGRAGGSGQLHGRNLEVLLRLFQGRQCPLENFQIQTKFVNGVRAMESGITFRRIGEGQYMVVIQTTGEPSIRELEKTPLDAVAGYLALKGIEVLDVQC
jgi:hypothetical protein